MGRTSCVGGYGQSHGGLAFLTGSSRFKSCAGRWEQTCRTTGTLKDTQGALRHASITTTGNV